MKLTQKEVKYLTMLLMAEFNEKNNRQLHAASHNSDFYDPDITTCESLIEKIQGDFVEYILDSVEGK